MLPFHWIKNLGLALLVALQLGMGLLAYERIAANRESITTLGDDLAAELSLIYRVERSLRLASTLFLFDLSEAYVPADSIVQIIEELRSFSGRLDSSAQGTVQAELPALRERCAKIIAGLASYRAAEKLYSSDRQLIAAQLRLELDSLARQTGDLSYLADLPPAEQSAVAALYELGQAARELFRQVEDNAVHQPEVIVRLLQQASEYLADFYRDEAEEAGQDPGHLETLQRLVESVDAIRAYLPGIYRLWSYDPNLSYLTDEIRKISRLWDNAQLDLDLLTRAEQQAFARQRQGILQDAARGMLQFSVVLGCALLGSLLLAIILSRALKTRMRPLVDAVHGYAGEGTVPRLEVRGKDELALLARAFNEMTDRLQLKESELRQTLEHLLQAQAGLQEAHGHLELRVAERTRELQAANTRLLLMGKVFDHAGEGILVADCEGEIIMANPEFLRMTGFRAAEIVGRRTIVFRLTGNDDFLSEMGRVVRQTGEWSGETLLNGAQGEMIPVDMSVSAYSHGDGMLAGVVAMFHDLRKIKEQEATIRFQAFHDTLTGLPNRLLLVDHLSYAMERAKRRGHKVGIFFFDLDNFKKINDTQGHPFGDQLLLAFSGLLRQSFRAEDTVCRLGGDEFVAVLEEAPDSQTIYRKAQALIATLSGYLAVQGREVHVSTSLGVSIYPDHGETVDDLLKNADLAMYAAKAEGKNTFYLFHSALDEKSRDDLALEEAVRKALDEKEFQVYYQPQVELDSMRLVGAEALVRWVRADGQVVSPGRFIPLCEETGLIMPLGEQVLRATCLYAADLCARPGYEHLRFAVNVSAKQFSDPQFLPLVNEALAESGLSPTNLEVEITESAMMVNVENTRRLLHQLEALGVSIAIDDFGTGYSSLMHLKHFPIHTLKIDSSFIRDVPGDESDERIVETILAMARNLGLSVVAEGVETPEQRSYLLDQGCQTLQGYLVSRPLPGDEFPRLAARLSGR